MFLKKRAVNRLEPLCLVLFSLWMPAVGFAKQPNVLLICVDDLRPELGCYGVPYIHSPNIDALADRACLFTRHYVQAPTCGASRYALLTGRYGPSGNGALFQRGQRLTAGAEDIPPSMPAYFRQHGYRTVSIGKVSHHPGGRGGPDWDDDSDLEMPESWNSHQLPAGPWKHPRGAMHGLANGQIRQSAGTMAVFESVDGEDSIYPDGLITAAALKQLEQFAEHEAESPFLLAVGLIRPHLPFGSPAKYMRPYDGVELPLIPHPNRPAGKTTWHGSGEFKRYQSWGKDPNQDAEFATEVRKHYAACVTYADAQVGKLLAQLERLKLSEETVVVLWGDHGWHLGEHAVWGKHTLFEESLRSPLIVSYPQQVNRGVTAKGIVESIDIFPTLCQLVGLPMPEFTHGESFVGLLEDSTSAGGDAISYASARTIRTDTHRLIEHRDGWYELYDHTSAEGETKNLAAEQPELAETLAKKLRERLQR